MGGDGDGEEDDDYVVVFVFPRRPYARMLQPSVSRWSPARVQRNRLHPIHSSMNWLPPELETVSTKHKRFTMTVIVDDMMMVMMMTSSSVCPSKLIDDHPADVFRVDARSVSDGSIVQMLLGLSVILVVFNTPNRF